MRSRSHGREGRPHRVQTTRWTPCIRFGHRRVRLRTTRRRSRTSPWPRPRRRRPSLPSPFFLERSGAASLVGYVWYCLDFSPKNGIRIEVSGSPGANLSCRGPEAQARLAKRGAAMGTVSRTCSSRGASCSASGRGQPGRARGPRRSGFHGPRRPLRERRVPPVAEKKLRGGGLRASLSSSGAEGFYEDFSEQVSPDLSPTAVQVAAPRRPYAALPDIARLTRHFPSLPLVRGAGRVHAGRRFAGRAAGRAEVHDAGGPRMGAALPAEGHLHRR